MKARSLREVLADGATASPEHRKLVRAIAKADGDRERAIRNVCRLYGVKDFDALPAHIRSAVCQALP